MSSIPKLELANTFSEWLVTINTLVDGLNYTSSNAMYSSIVRYDSNGSFEVNDLTLSSFNLNGIINNISQDFSTINDNTLVTANAIYNFISGSDLDPTTINANTLQLQNGTTINNISVDFNTIDNNTVPTTTAVLDVFGSGTISPIFVDIHSDSLSVNNFSTSESIAQGYSSVSGKGSVATPWIYTSAIEAYNEKGTVSTGILIGSAGATSTNTAVPTDTVAIFTNGNIQFKVDSVGDGYFNGNVNVADVLIVDQITNRTGQQLILNAGESQSKFSGQTGEFVYVNAESGIYVSTPDRIHPNYQTGYTQDSTIIRGDTITINGNTVWHQGNDGIGSGLNADLLDGVDSAFFLRNDVVNTKDGTVLSVRPATTGGNTSIFLNSNTNYGSDKGFILCQDESSFCAGTGGEDLRLTIGVFNDFRSSSAHSDEFWLQGGGRLVYNVGSWDSELDSIIGTPAVGTTGGFEWRVNNVKNMELTHAGNLLVNGTVTQGVSDDRLKTNKTKLNNVLEKLDQLEGFTYQHNDLAKSLGFDENKTHVGVSAQQVKNVLPELTRLSPVDDDGNGNSISGENYLTVDYSKLSVLLLEAIKEIKQEVSEIKSHLKI